MIKNLLFDFGDVFINLDKLKPYDKFKKLGYGEPTAKMLQFNKDYEIGAVTTKEFTNFYVENAPTTIKPQDVKQAWNSMLLDFPQHRLNFIKELASVKNFKLILLSNTNDLHIDWIKAKVPHYLDFKMCFDAFYLSQELHLRKPDASCFKHILKEEDIIAEETLFIDDTKENTDAAKALGFKIWNINPKTEDVVDLFTINENLF